MLLSVRFRTIGLQTPYTLLIERDLLGDLSVVRCWYGLHNRRGGYKRELFTDLELACDEYRRMVARRLYRGYVVIHEHKAAA